MQRSKMIHFPSWPGIVPAIHVFLAAAAIDVDARDRPGHDDLSINPRFYWLHFESDSEADPKLS